MMFFLPMMFIALAASFFEVLGLILLAFKLEYKRKVYSFLLSPILTVGILLLWFSVMSLGFSFPFHLWTLHSDLVVKVLLAGIVIGLLATLSAKLWMMDKFNQFIRQSVSVIIYLAGWLSLSVIHLYTMAMAMELSLR